MRWTLSTDWLRAGTGRTGPTANCPRGARYAAIWPSVAASGRLEARRRTQDAGFERCVPRDHPGGCRRNRGEAGARPRICSGILGGGCPGRGILAGCAQSQRPPARRACLVARTRRGLTPPILCGKRVAGRGADGPDSLDGDHPKAKNPRPIRYPDRVIRVGTTVENCSRASKVHDALQRRTKRERVSTTSVVFANDSRGTGVA